jgi:hypothetical protein
MRKEGKAGQGCIHIGKSREGTGGGRKEGEKKRHV